MTKLFENKVHNNKCDLICNKGPLLSKHFVT